MLRKKRSPNESCANNYEVINVLKSWCKVSEEITIETMMMMMMLDTKVFGRSIKLLAKIEAKAFDLTLITLLRSAMREKSERAALKVQASCASE